MGSETSGVRLEVRNLSKRFGSVVALEDVSFSVRPGEIVGLVGDNGAGKSTAIKLICGYYRPSGGTILWEGAVTELESPEHARSLGIQTVYQDLALVNTLSIARNFFLHAEPVRRLGPVSFLNVKEMNERTAQILRDIGIKDLNPTTHVSALSGGERQAVAIGRTYYFGGKLLILDEPTSALSVKQTQKVFSIIQEVKAKGVSVILIEHNMIHVHDIADRLVVVRHGNVYGDYAKADVGVADLERILAGAR